MLAGMNDRSFVVTTAYLKTEAIQTAVFGFVFLADHLTSAELVAILIATIGVVVTALATRRREEFRRSEADHASAWSPPRPSRSRRSGSAAPSSRCPGVTFVTAASYTLVFGLFLQTLVLTVYLLARAPGRAEEDPRPVEALDVRGLHGRVRLAVLVPGLRADGGRQCAHPGADRGAVRAGVAYYSFSSRSRCASYRGLR